MIFSISVITILAIIFLWERTRPKYSISYLEPSTPSIDSYRESKKTRNRYFYHSSGRVDLSKHRELLRFKEINGDKEYLVEPWNRKENLYVKEGVTKVVIFEFLKGLHDNIIAVIPCLRTVETVLEEENNDPLLDYKEIHLGVCWDSGRKIVNSENLFGIIRYESI